MEQYCTKCGEKLRDGAAYCHRCGAPAVNAAAKSPELDAAAKLLVNGKRKLAKGLAAFLGYIIAFSCIASAGSMVIVAAYLIYQFAKGMTVYLPLFLANAFAIHQISGFGLIFGGLVLIFVAAIQVMASIALFRGIRTIRNAQ